MLRVGLLFYMVVLKLLRHATGLVHVIVTMLMLVHVVMLMPVSVLVHVIVVVVAMTVVVLMPVVAVLVRVIMLVPLVVIVRVPGSLPYLFIFLSYELFRLAVGHAGHIGYGEVGAALPGQFAERAEAQEVRIHTISQSISTEPFITSF